MSQGNVFDGLLDVHVVAMPAPNVNVAPRGAKAGPSKGPKFVQLTMPAGELAGLKASLGIDMLTSKLVELVAVVSNMASTRCDDDVGEYHHDGIPWFMF
jgi:hypothetical protein